MCNNGNVTTSSSSLSDIAQIISSLPSSEERKEDAAPKPAAKPDSVAPSKMTIEERLLRCEQFLFAKDSTLVEPFCEGAPTLSKSPSPTLQSQSKRKRELDTENDADDGIEADGSAAQSKSSKHARIEIE